MHTSLSDSSCLTSREKCISSSPAASVAPAPVLSAGGSANCLAQPLLPSASAPLASTAPPPSHKDFLSPAHLNASSWLSLKSLKSISKQPSSNRRSVGVLRFIRRQSDDDLSANSSSESGTDLLEPLRIDDAADQEVQALTRADAPLHNMGTPRRRIAFCQTPARDSAEQLRPARSLVIRRLQYSPNTSSSSSSSSSSSPPPPTPPPGGGAGGGGRGGGGGGDTPSSQGSKRWWQHFCETCTDQVKDHDVASKHRESLSKFCEEADAIFETNDPSGVFDHVNGAVEGLAALFKTLPCNNSSNADLMFPRLENDRKNCTACQCHGFGCSGNYQCKKGKSNPEMRSPGHCLFDHEDCLCQTKSSNYLCTFKLFQVDPLAINPCALPTKLLTLITDDVPLP
jgi:hypothetical protein